MSGKRIVVVEEVCQHGNVKCWELLNPDAPLGAEGEWCDDGSRRVLTEGQYVPVVRTSVLAQTYAITDDPTEADAYLIPLDALSDHTEGTP